MLLYLVLYLQDILGYSPLATGARPMVISGGILATSTVAGRLTSPVSVRLLIGPGLIVIGAGLLLMRGLDAGSAWTHLIPGMIVGGVGVGVVNPPLASTAVGVVPPQRAGMASGINSTFRQVGIAIGIALLGTLFSNNVKDEVLARVAAVPGLSRSGPQIAAAVQSGEIRNVIARLPRTRQAGGGNDRPSRLHHEPEPHSAGRGGHRGGIGSNIPGRYPLRGRDFAQQQRPGSPG
jgi:MFS transporter